MMNTQQGPTRARFEPTPATVATRLRLEDQSSELRNEQPLALNALFRALGDPTRLAILERLHRTPMAVTQIVQGFHLSQPSISRHLSILKAAGLVSDERHGQRVVYKLRDGGSVGLGIDFLERIGSASPKHEVV